MMRPSLQRETAHGNSSAPTSDYHLEATKPGREEHSFDRSRGPNSKGRSVARCKLTGCRGRRDTFLSAHWGASCPRQGSSAPTQPGSTLLRTFFRPWL